jgi:REP element-mobilizing transposase RayT
MPRAARHIRPGCVYHLISRFVDRNWFIKKEQERRDYLELLGRALTTSDWQCLAYAIMSNHIHLAVLAGSDPLHTWIRRVHSPFADSMNRAYNRIGPMFVRGPKALLVPDNAVAGVVAYIHNNPVRAKLVDAASESSWTSHRAYVGLARVPGWLDVSCARLGFDDATAFDRWVMDPTRATFDELHDLDVKRKDMEPKRQHSTGVDPHALVTLIAAEVGISVAQLQSTRRTSVEVLAREAVVLCAQRVGLKGVDTARALGVSQQAISRIGQRGVGPEAIALGSRVLLQLQSQG